MRGDLQRILEELLSLKEITKNAEQCQKCKMATSMTGSNEIQPSVTHANIGHSILNLNIVFEILNFMLYLDAERGVYCKSV